MMPMIKYKQKQGGRFYGKNKIKIDVLKPEEHMEVWSEEKWSTLSDFFDPIYVSFDLQIYSHGGDSDGISGL